MNHSFRLNHKPGLVPRKKSQTMETALQFHEKLTAAVGDPARETRVHSKMKKGHVGHQGDVYIHKIADRPKAWDVLVTEHTQVALGSTVGSRHVATGNVRVYWPKSKDAAVTGCPIPLFPHDETARRVCLGPIVEADAPWILDHPEHAPHEFPQGTYLLSFQFDYATKREVRD